MCLGAWQVYKTGLSQHRGCKGSLSGSGQSTRAWLHVAAYMPKPRIAKARIQTPSHLQTRARQWVSVCTLHQEGSLQLASQGPRRSAWCLLGSIDITDGRLPALGFLAWWYAAIGGRIHSQCFYIKVAAGRAAASICASNMAREHGRVGWRSRLVPIQSRRSRTLPDQSCSQARSARQRAGFEDGKSGKRSFLSRDYWTSVPTCCPA